MTRNDARAQELTRYATGKPCRNGHIDYRYTNTGACAGCVRSQGKRRRAGPDAAGKTCVAVWVDSADAPRIYRYVNALKRARALGLIG